MPDVCCRIRQRDRGLGAVLWRAWAPTRRVPLVLDLRASAGRLKSVAMIPTPDLSHLKSEDYKHIYEPAGQTWLLWLSRWVQYLLPVRRGYFHSSGRPGRGCRRPPEDVIRYMR